MTCVGMSFAGDEEGEPVQVPCGQEATVASVCGDGLHAICDDCHAGLSDYPEVYADYFPLEGFA